MELKRTIIGKYIAPIAVVIFLVVVPLLAQTEQLPEEEHLSFKERFAHQLENYGISEGAVVIIVSALPIFELRGGLPLALAFYKMPIPQAYAYAIIGNMLPILPILYLLGPVSSFLMMRFDFFRRFFEWLFARTRRKSDIIRRYEMIGLILFVAIPLPVTGAYTGSVAAFLFGFEPKKSFGMIFLGVLIASSIVGIVTSGGMHIFQFFQNIG